MSPLAAAVKAKTSPWCYDVSHSLKIFFYRTNVGVLSVSCRFSKNMFTLRYCECIFFIYIFNSSVFLTLVLSTSHRVNLSPSIFIVFQFLFCAVEAEQSCHLLHLTHAQVSNVLFLFQTLHTSFWFSIISSHWVIKHIFKSVTSIWYLFNKAGMY